MANSTRSSCKTIEENSRGRQSGGGGSDISLSIESSGLRRSTRDTSCKKTTTPKKSTPQQSGQANKQVATSPVTRSLAQKATTSSPLRRSKRCNKQSSSPKSSESTAKISSRSPELNNKKRKVERREKTPKQSVYGTMKPTENVDREYDSGRAKRIRMTGRVYKALFRKQEKQVKVSGKYEELASPSKSPAKDGSNSGGCMSKERAAAVEAGQVTATKISPRKETAENLHEKESTQISQINSAGQVVIQDTANVDESVNEKIHSLPLLSVTELREIDISILAELPEVADSSTKEKGNDVDVYEERVVEGRADATAIAVCKDNSSDASPPSHQENHVGEATPVNMSRKSGKLEDGVDIRLDKHSVQISVQKLAIQGNGAVVDVEQLPGCSAFVCKEDSSKFMEYWVPAQLSHLQLEKYCSVLLSSSLTLRSSLKSDIFGALGDILADIRKCCDHPYLLDKDKDNSLDSFLKSLELTQLLDIGIQASGKLDLLVKFLVEMRARGMRALILFQSISNFGKDPKSSGDILDDLMRQKFGVDSYERVDAGLVRGKVQTALNNFNDKELGRFAFLLEGRACRPSIKLSSVDVVIVFTSDLNPANDIRNLQKLTMDSEYEKLKVLRLYSCFTVEEKVLINAKQRIGMDVRLHEINSLLRWGASYLFDRLKEFHCNTGEPSKLIIYDPFHADDVVKELISLLSVVGDKNISNSSMIVRVQQNAGVYSTESLLVGESKNHLSMEKLPHIFWAELLEGKYPPWRYLSNSGQRNRKRLQNSGGLHVEQGENIDQAGNKRIKLATDNCVHKKLANDNGVQSSTKRGNEEGKTAIEAARSYPPPPENGASNSMAECDESRKRLSAQRSLLCILQPDVSRLCEVLNLTDDVKQKADIFLSYVVNNHQVDREPKSILQAFLLALCWTAASLSEVKVNHKESFELAKDHLSYFCEWNQAEYVYKMMQCLKEMFLNKTQSSEAEDYRTPSSNISQSAVFSPVNRQVNLEDIPLVQDNPSKSDVYDLNKLAERNIQKIKNKSLKRMRKLLLLHEKERNKICSAFEEAKANFDKEHRIEAAVVRSLHGEGPTRTDKLNALESEYNRKVEDHKNQMLASLSEHERAHIDDRTKLQLKEASLIKELSEWVRIKLLKKPAESAGGGETCFSDSDGPDIIKLNGVRASAAPKEAPDAAIAPEESLSGARAPEEAPSEAGAHEEAPAAAKAPDAVGASKEAPDEVRAPEETPAAANAPEEAPDAAGAPEEAPNEARAPEEAPAAAKAPEEAPDAAVSPQEVPGAPLAVISASEDSSNPVMRFRLSSESNVPFLVPVVTGLLDHHTGANILDQDREDVSVGPCPTESIPNGATSLLPDDEIPLNENQNTSTLGNTDQDNLPPQEREVPSETSSLPRREGPLDKESRSRFPDHVAPRDAHSEDMQIDFHFEGTVATHEETVNLPDGEAATDIGSIDLQAARHLIGDTSGNHIVGDVPSRLNNISVCKERPMSEVNVGVSDATSADEQDISGNSNQQEPRPDGRGNSTPPQLVDISLQDESVLQLLPDEPQNQCNAGYTSNRTHKGNGSSVERLNAPAQVSMPMVSSTTNDGQAQPDKPASNAAQTERTLDMQNIPDLSPVSRTAQPPSTNGCTSLNFPEAGQVSEPLEASRPLSHAVQCTVNTQATHVPTNSIASGSGIGTMQPSFCMPSGKSDPLQIELDKIRKQMDHSIKNFEETKKQLEVECQKEIAKIRQKFAVKIQESEVEYVSEKNELETNLQKVVVNKVLAAAFRYKCMDPKKAGTPSTTFRPPDVRSSSQPWIASAASVHRFSSSAAGATYNSQSITQPTAVVQPRAPDATSNSQPINPPTTAVPPRAPAPVRPPPLVKTLHRSPLRPSSHRPLLSHGQREVVIRSPAPHLQSASRPLSHGVAPRSIPPPPGYQPQSSSAQFPKPRAVAQTGPSSSVANRMDQLGSRIPQPPNVHDRLHFISNTLNAAQPSNLRLSPVNVNITTTTTASFSEVRPSRESSNGSAIIDAANIIELSDEE